MQTNRISTEQSDEVSNEDNRMTDNHATENHITTDNNMNIHVDNHIDKNVISEDSNDGINQGMSQFKRASMVEAKPCIGRCWNFEPTVVMTLCSHTMSLFHPMLAYGIYLVVPYHVLATPELGWGVESFSILFASVAFGEIAGAQVVAIAAAFDSDTALYIGHISQWIGCFLGYCIMSGVFTPFNFWLFSFSLFLLGYSYGMPAVQAYATEIANGDESVEIALMAAGGRLYIISLLLSSFVMPLLYQLGGFAFFCLCMGFCAAFCSGVLFILILEIKARVAALDFEEGQLDDLLNESHASDCGSDLEASDSQEEQEAKNKKNKKQDEGDAVHISLSATMSPSMYVLLYVKFGFAFSSQAYYVAYPVIFSLHFGIDAVTGGYLYAAAGLFGFFALYLNQKASFHFDKWDYPYDITLFFAIMFVCTLFYFIFPGQSWVGYSLHWIFLGSAFAVSGIEMTSRLYLSPTVGFQKLTGFSGLIQAVTYVAASLIAAPLMTISVTMPMLAIAIVCLSTFILALLVFVVRVRFLAGRFGSNDISYLVQERVFYEKLKKSQTRRRAVVDIEHVSLLEDMEQKLNLLQKQFASRQGLAFLMNRNAGARLEAFANNAAVQEEVDIQLAQRLPQAQGKNYMPGNKVEITDTRLSVGRDNNRNFSKFGDKFKVAMGLDHRQSVSILQLSKVMGTQQPNMANKRLSNALMTSKQSVLKGKYGARSSALFLNDASKRVSITRQHQSKLECAVRQSIMNFTPLDSVNEERLAAPRGMGIARRSMARQMVPCVTLLDSKQATLEETKRRTRSSVFGF